MNTQSLSSVAHHVVDQYSQIGKLVVGTYRTGAQRLITGANSRYVSLLQGRELRLVNDAIKANLINVQTKIAEALVGGITAGTGRADQAIDFVTAGANGGIKRAVAAVDRVEAALNTTALTSVGKITLPVAQVSLEIANRAVEGAQRLSTRVIGAESGVAEAVVAVKTVAKRAAKKAVRTVKAKAKTRA